MKYLPVFIVLLAMGASHAFTLTASAGPNGEVGPTTSIEVEPGGFFFFYANGNYDWQLRKYYRVDKWYLDGREAQVGGHDFRVYNVQADHSVSVTFALQREYTVNVTLGDHGEAYRVEPWPWPWESKVRVTAEPFTGYVVDRWFLDGQPHTCGHSMFEILLDHDCDIHVTFRPLVLDETSLDIMLSHWGEKECWTTIPWHTDCFDADLNFDRRIDMRDFAIVAEHWLKSGTLYGIQTARILAEELDTVRAAIEQYKIEHNGRLPSRERFGIEMCACTDIHGAAMPCDANALGPYLHIVPWNPFTYGTDIGGTDWDYDPTTGDFNAVVGSPDDISSGDWPYGGPRFQKFLGAIRDAIEQYKVDHNGRFPALDRFHAQLTGMTDADGNAVTNAHVPHFGPYLECIPVNPYTGRNRVVTEESGWSDYWYDEERGFFRFGDSGSAPDGTAHTCF